MQCKAHARTTGEQCKNFAINNKSVCRMHGAFSTGPRDQEGNKNAVKHGLYETLVREHLPEEEREAFDRVDTTPDLAAELRINRYKMLRLMGEVDQNVIVGGRDARVAVIKADNLAKIEAIVKLSDNIRKLIKDMQGAGEDEALLELAASWEEGLRSEGKLNDTQPQPETT